MLDIKHIDDTEHRKLTGQSNVHILEFAQYLKEKNIPVWIRHVVVPGITLQEKYLRQLGAYLAGLDNLKALDVLPYHTMGEVKYENLGIPYPLKGVEPATTEQAIWARNTILDALKEQLRKEIRCRFFFQRITARIFPPLQVVREIANQNVNVRGGQRKIGIPH